MLVLLVLASILFGGSKASCIDCICKHESGCQPIGCRMDMGSLSCGYFQIKLPYYIDCGQPGKRETESTEDAWRRCSDNYNCALGCVQSYFARYHGFCSNYGYGECEQLSRIHNGGLYGCQAERTNVYWDWVRNCCGCS